MERFLLYSAGVDLELIETCPRQKLKYKAIGAMVVCTAVMAALSGGFAFFTIFGNPVMACFFGLFWGFGVIYNMDRLFLASLRPHENRYFELLALLPRMAMAFLLAVVISKPLELYIFRSEIAAKQAILNTEAAAAAKHALDAAPAYHDKMERLTDENKALNNQIAEAREKSQKAYAAYLEAGRDGGTDPAILQERKARALQLDARLQTITSACNAQIQDNKAQLKQMEQEKTAKAKIEADAKKSSNGLLVRIHALDAICSEDPAAAQTNTALSLIFFAIEMLPLLIKLLGTFNKHRPYEAQLEAAEAAEVALAETLTQEMEARNATDASIILEREQTRLAAEKRITPSIVQMIVDGKQALAEEAIRVWMDQQRALLEHDPQQFFLTH